jgi:hypothetical protein
MCKWKITRLAKLIGQHLRNALLMAAAFSEFEPALLEELLKLT